MPAFANYNAEDEVEFELTIDYLYKNPADIAVTQGKSSSVTLYPGVSTRLEYELARSLRAKPEKRGRVGYLRATEKRSGGVVAEIEIVEE